MDILVNGQPRTARDDLTVAELVAELGLAGKRLAVEVNRDIVPRGEHATRTLHDGDRIEIIHAIGGG
ncbi:MAG: sulfur carrier protein ThiS [Immundisolibacter sp.]|uniref:sulfur carrier protein ThiS n=1 Tax=Immundisolibacter sp. TaxID=1934948 RepID=UPI001988881C|nr:sulfur carrier protein ThiS [Immundisolibacter sp.]